jgi:hypothetical protein
MKKLTLLATAVLVAGLVSASSAQYPSNGYLGLYGDVAGTQCCITVPPYVPTSTYLIAKLAGASAAGITAVEFRMEFSNTAYITNWTADVGLAVSLGNPIDLTPAETPLQNPNTDTTDDAGANLAYEACKGDVTGSVQFGVLQLINLANPGPELVIKIKRKEPPSNPNNAAPLFVLCDAPVFTAVMMTLRQTEIDQNPVQEPVAFKAYVNQPGCTACGPVSVAPATWTGVKALFR